MIDYRSYKNFVYRANYGASLAKPFQETASKKPIKK